MIAAIRIPLVLRKTLADDDSVHVGQCCTEFFPVSLFVLSERFFLILPSESKVATAGGAPSLGTEAKLKHSLPLSGIAWTSANLLFASTRFRCSADRQFEKMIFSAG
jgi:hypothetical protein